MDVHCVGESGAGRKNRALARGDGPKLKTDIIGLSSALRNPEYRIRRQQGAGLHGGVHCCLESGYRIPAMTRSATLLAVIGDGEIVGLVGSLNRQKRSGLRQSRGGGDQPLEIAATVDDEVHAGRL